MGLLIGQRAVVTGGGSGIGRAACRRFAAEGAAVAVLDIDGDCAQATAKEIDGVAIDGRRHRCRGTAGRRRRRRRPPRRALDPRQQRRREHHGGAWPTGTPTSGTASCGST